jgi:hypothetical protein
MRNPKLPGHFGHVGHFLLHIYAFISRQDEKEGTKSTTPKRLISERREDFLFCQNGIRRKFFDILIE